MQIGKDVALVAIGAAAVLAYQKYHKPVMEKIEKTTEEVLKRANKKLDSMI
jgi:hypothetical protein